MSCSASRGDVRIMPHWDRSATLSTSGSTAGEFFGVGGGGGGEGAVNDVGGNVLAPLLRPSLIPNQLAVPHCLCDLSQSSRDHIRWVVIWLCQHITEQKQIKKRHHKMALVCHLDENLVRAKEAKGKIRRFLGGSECHPCVLFLEACPPISLIPLAYASVSLLAFVLFLIRHGTLL